MSLSNLWSDWFVHLATSPDKQMDLALKANTNWTNWFRFVGQGCPSDPQAYAISPKKGDRRFRHEGWSKPPFAALQAAFLLAEDYADKVSSDIPGLQPDHDRAMSFVIRQIMDAMSPSNFLATNPEAVARTYEEKGANLFRGAMALQHDVVAATKGEAPRPTKRLGTEVATASGKVVLRNHLMELIQYTPTTKQVHPEPILIVPAWIMKFYILDLSPENSLVNYLTSQGFTVFMISWLNPDASDAQLGMADYLEQGPQAALDHISNATPAKKIHGVGYCLGGTLLSIAAAAMARDDDDRLASLTLFAAQTDFSEPGELEMFISESQISVLEDIMAEQGFLDASQMMGAFQILRSNDLIWSRLVRRYMLGDDDGQMNDLMSWNTDTTRMPARMHSQYLRDLFLNNDLATGRYMVRDRPIFLRDVQVPIFCVGTETDHIAPWKSVFKIHRLSSSDVTFVLTNGGHNAGVISEPGHKRRHFHIRTTHNTDHKLSPAAWLNTADQQEGSWWSAWTSWLGTLSGAPQSPPKMGKSLADAPGTYVMKD